MSLEAPPLEDAAGTVKESVLTLTGGTQPWQRPSDPTAAKALTSSFQFYCVFDDGGSVVADGVPRFALGAHFAASPVTFLVLDLAAGKAQMSGDVGGSGSLEGTSAMRVTATDTTMNFSGFTPLGQLVVTTIFATKTASGHYAAIRSGHGLREPHIGDQYAGSCDGDSP